MENFKSCLPGRQTGENTEKYINKLLKNSSNPVKLLGLKNTVMMS